MARCDCSSTQQCQCLVTGGEGIEVTGAGTLTNPYVVTSTGSVDISGAVTFADSATVDFTTTGSGTTEDPWTVTASTTTSVADLTDVSCASPANGDVLVWDGSGWSCTAPSLPDMALDDLSDVTAPAPAENDVLTWDGTAWVSGPVTAPPGAINSEHGLSGDGTAATPLRVETVAEYTDPPLDVYTGDQLHGTPVYVDSNNQLRIPSTEGPYTVQGITTMQTAGMAYNADNVAVSADTYVSLYRFGPIIWFYLAGFDFIPSGSSSVGDLPNAGTFKFPFSAVGSMSNGLTGRTTIYQLLTSGWVSCSSTTQPYTAGTPFAQSIAGTAILLPSEDPNTVLAPFRANAEQPAIDVLSNLLQTDFENG